MEFSDKCAILADLWLNYKDMDALQDFLEYNDVGMPLAYFIHSEMVTPEEEAFGYVEETYESLVDSLGLDINAKFYTLAEMLDKVEG
jgi:hypothetical protein